jgi:hypothetical protein
MSETSTMHYWEKLYNDDMGGLDEPEQVNNDDNILDNQ